MEDHIPSECETVLEWWHERGWTLLEAVTGKRTTVTTGRRPPTPATPVNLLTIDEDDMTLLNDSALKVRDFRARLAKSV